MTLIQACVALSTFSLVATGIWNLACTPHPCRDAACVFRWVAWGALNMGLVLGAAMWWIDHYRMPMPDEWHLCLLRFSAALLLLWPLRRREGVQLPGVRR